MKEKPIISIITPTLNSEYTIDACLKSVAEQTFNKAEHLLIDGLSTDRTPEIIKTYQSKFRHIRMIREKDSGIYDAFNKGIKLAEGEWLYFLGSDDELFNQYVLEKVNNSFLSRNKVSIIYGNVLIGKNILWARQGEIYDGPFTVNKLLRKNICHQALFYKRELFLNYGLYDQDIPVCADWGKNIQLFRIVRTQYIPDIIAKFGGGISGSFNQPVSAVSQIDPIIKRYFPIRYYWRKLRVKIKLS